MSPLSVPVRPNASFWMRLETAENRNFGTESERNACCTEVLFSLARFCINMIPYLFVCWKVVTDFVTQNKQKVR